MMENIIIAAVFIAVVVAAGCYVSRRAQRDYYTVPPVDENIAAQIIGRPVTYRGVKRNEPCPCGSGKKFKACHLAGRER
jgi:preprotein translocase subunit SecA